MKVVGTCSRTGRLPSCGCWRWTAAAAWPGWRRVGAQGAVGCQRSAFGLEVRGRVDVLRLSAEGRHPTAVLQLLLVLQLLVLQLLLVAPSFSA